MNFLRSLLNKATHQSGCGAVTITYMQLQRYFQLFVPTLYAVKNTPPMNDTSITIPGQILSSFDVAEADDFFSDDSSFTCTAEFDNGNGGHIYHGEYVTHGAQGGANEYLYVVIASSETTEDKKRKLFIPHFVFLGGRVGGDQYEMVHTLFLLTQSAYDGQSAGAHVARDGDLPDFVSALAYADLPLKTIFAGEKVNADLIAADFENMHMAVRYQKFDFIANNRDPHSLNLEITEP